MTCQSCKIGKLKKENCYPYLTIIVTYYKCSNCGHEIKITALKETWRRLMSLKMYSSQTFDKIIDGLIDYSEHNVKGGIIKNDTQNKDALEKIGSKKIHRLWG